MMSTVFVFKVGPFALAHGHLSIYFAYGSDLDPISGTDDAEALRVVAAHDRGARLTCEPRLREAGEKLGYVVTPFSRLMAHRCAVASLQLAVAPSLEDIEDDDVIDCFCEAAQEFVFARVTAVLPRATAFSVEVEGSLQRRYESMLQGESTDVYGLVLYEEPGSLARLRSDAWQPTSAPVASLGLFLRSGPVFAIEALRRVYGLDWLPQPTRVRQGHRANLTSVEVLTLAATARALADLASTRSSAAAASLQVGGVGVDVVVRVSDP